MGERMLKMEFLDQDVFASLRFFIKNVGYNLHKEQGQQDVEWFVNPAPTSYLAFQGRRWINEAINVDPSSFPM